MMQRLSAPKSLGVRFRHASEAGPYSVWQEENNADCKKDIRVDTNRKEDTYGGAPVYKSTNDKYIYCRFPSTITDRHVERRIQIFRSSPSAPAQSTPTLPSPATGPYPAS